MRPVKLERNEDGTYADGNIVISNFRSWIITHESNIQRSGKNSKEKVYNGICFHCTVKNVGKLIARLTLIVTLCDEQGFNIGSASDSVLCLEEGENWEAYGKTQIDNYSLTDETGFDGKTRNNCVLGGPRKHKVFVIEEDDLGSTEDTSGTLGQI